MWGVVSFRRFVSYVVVSYCTIWYLVLSTANCHRNAFVLFILYALWGLVYKYSNTLSNVELKMTNKITNAMMKCDAVRCMWLHFAIDYWTLVWLLFCCSFLLKPKSGNHNKVQFLLFFFHFIPFRYRAQVKEQKLHTRVSREANGYKYRTSCSLIRIRCDDYFASIALYTFKPTVLFEYTIQDWKWITYWILR